MSVERVNPPSRPRPSGFTYAVVAAGKQVYLAGQTGLGADGSVVPGGLVAQFEQALANLLEALAAAGGRPDQLVSLTVYAVDLADYRRQAAEIGAVWRRLVGAEYPAIAGLGVSALWDDGALVELQGIAVLPE